MNIDAGFARAVFLDFPPWLALGGNGCADSRRRDYVRTCGGLKAASRLLPSFPKAPHGSASAACSYGVRRKKYVTVTNSPVASRPRLFCNRHPLRRRVLCAEKSEN